MKQNGVQSYHKGERLCFRILVFLLAILTPLIFTLTLFVGFDIAAEGSARVLPSYEREDISALLEKESWTEEDFSYLYLQTGLGKQALLALKGNNNQILSIQDDFFWDAPLTHYNFGLVTNHDLTGVAATLAPLEEGDVLVTSSAHTLGWRNGHAAIVVNASERLILQSFAPGYPSDVDYSTWFQMSSNFMVLRLKDATYEQRAAIANYAMEHLLGVPYSLTVGIFSPKDQTGNIVNTHCSHLVWQAYKACGYDLDEDDGPVVTTRDIATSPLLEVVQVNGFDPIKLWN